MKFEDGALIKMPIIPLRGLTVLPKMSIQFDVGRKRSIAAVEVALKANTTVFLVAQKRLGDDSFNKENLNEIGTIAHIKQVLRLPDDNIRLMVEGAYRAKLVDVTPGRAYHQATVEVITETSVKDSIEAIAAKREAENVFHDYCKYVPKVSPEVLIHVIALQEPGELADYMASNINIHYSKKQKILETADPIERLKHMIAVIGEEVEIIAAENELRQQVKQKMDKNNKEYYLREQLKAIQSELNEEEDDDEIYSYKEKLYNLHLLEDDNKHFLKEINRLARLSSSSSEAGVVRTYLDTCLDLPWNTKTKEKIDLEAVKKSLDKDHYGMQKIKERIIEHLAVAKLTEGRNAQIICLVGPPGVGKTSIASSIAKAIGRKYERIALGGVRDEADIRGHRRTYVGALPGRIISALKHVKSKNPLILLDEVDKLTSDMRGDPSAALLEVLDSEQNSTFRDHYVEVPFDLSEIMFITTANTKDTIPRPLLDRMEVIEVSSYTDEEKKHIAQDHLVPKQLKKHGLKKSALKISYDMIGEIVDGYTRESGVRTLERRIAALCRKAAVRQSIESVKSITVTQKNITELLGPRQFKREAQNFESTIGVCKGLAYTSVGGETLSIEVNVVPGKGEKQFTGSLGDVMKESCDAAISYIRSRTEMLSIDPDFYKKTDVHVHFPEGAVPKDGPSAGIAITTAIVSAYTNRPVRGDIAMTGEVTLRGKVLPIGGLKEKTMAAMRERLSTVIIPYDNEPDLAEIDQEVRNALEFVPVKSVDEVLDFALLEPISVMNEDGNFPVMNFDNIDNVALFDC